MPEKLTTIMESQENCGVCGKPLVYGTEASTMTCSYCGKEFDSLISCPDGHFICDACHEEKAVNVLRQILKATESTAPLEILESILSHPNVPMHGPEHHVMVPAILVTAARNAGYPIPANAIEKAISRAAQVPGGWCGSHGACGGGLGVGIAVSVLTEATPLTGETRALANEATAFALSGMIDGEPRCCKRASRKGIELGAEFLEKHLGIKLDMSTKVKCRYMNRNRECIHTRCKYFGKD